MDGFGQSSAMYSNVRIVQHLMTDPTFLMQAIEKPSSSIAIRGMGI